MAQPVMSRESAQAAALMPASFVLSAIAPLYQGKDVEGFPSRLAEAAAAVLRTRETFAILCDRFTGRPELSSLRALAHTAQVRGFLQNYEVPAGNFGGASRSTEVITGPGIWMVPVSHESRIEALAGVVTRSTDGPAPDQIDALRALSRVAGPVIAAVRDAQQLRRGVDEREAQLQIKSVMVSHLSHELRSQLAAVRGYARRMADGRAGAMGEAAHHHVEVILRNTNKLLDLASHTLPFVTEQSPRIESFDLREPLEGVLRRMQRGEPERFAAITRQIPAEPFLVTGDRERLAVVFGILLASAGGAPTRSKTAIQFLRAATKEVTVKIFADHELPPSLVDSIFEHHEESPAPSVPQGEPGLSALSLAHDLIWLHGGRITVTSHSGEGTVFVFTLPPAQPGLQVHMKTQKPDRSMSGDEHHAPSG